MTDSLPLWLYEHGIGEDRAICVEAGAIVKAHVERGDGLLRSGGIVAGRLIKQLVAGRCGIVEASTGQQLLVEPLPKDVTEGMDVRVRILRGQIEEPGRTKLAKARIVPGDVALKPSPTLLERLTQTGATIEICGPHEADRFEEHGWSELLDQAQSGTVPFSGGALQIVLTPAMTVIDVDGELPLAELSLAAARAAARAIQQLDISGSIGIDFPTLEQKGDRTAIGQMVDLELRPPFERTAVNGFGFMQIIRKRERASIMELVQSKPSLSAAIALLRRAERTKGAGTCTLTAHPAVATQLTAQQEWIEELQKRLGRSVALLPDASLAIDGGYAD